APDGHQPYGRFGRRRQPASRLVCRGLPAIVTQRCNDAASPAQPLCKNEGDRTLLVALHDVTPAHAARLEQAERLLTRPGVPAVTYLFVPDFHRRPPPCTNC